VGLGVAILPLCDLVLASDKATFYMPYADLGQSLEGAASLTFPRLSGSLVSACLKLFCFSRSNFYISTSI